LSKIIFLDIDGPMIPGSALLVDPFASIDQKLDSRCVSILHKMLIDWDARIVFNTYHNNWLYSSVTDNSHEMMDGYFVGSKSTGLIHSFINVGLEDFIHDTVCTEFPNIKVGKYESGRLPAINKWLEKNGEHNWICFDDEFIDHERAYKISYDHGLDTKAYIHAEKWFNG
jgi:hypothetical protein